MGAASQEDGGHVYVLTPRARRASRAPRTSCSQHRRLHSRLLPVPSQRPSSSAQHSSRLVPLLGAAQPAPGTFVPLEEPSTRVPKPPHTSQSTSKPTWVPQDGAGDTGAISPATPKNVCEVQIYCSRLPPASRTPCASRCRS